jgi:hypothetical protein
VLKAVREALDEEIAAHALEVAITELRKRIEAAEPRALEAELAVLDRKIETALDLALELGDVAAVKDRLRGLRDERGRVAGDLARARVDLPTAEDLMPLIREKLQQIEATIRPDVARGRLALGALLGERRIRVYRDGQIEGALALEPEMKLPAPRRSQEPADSVVAGGRYARDSPRSRFRCRCGSPGRSSARPEWRGSARPTSRYLAARRSRATMPRRMAVARAPLVVAAPQAIRDLGLEQLLDHLPQTHPPRFQQVSEIHLREATRSPAGVPRGPRCGGGKVPSLGRDTADCHPGIFATPRSASEARIARQSLDAARLGVIMVRRV